MRELLRRLWMRLWKHKIKRPTMSQEIEYLRELGRKAKDSGAYTK